MPADSGNYWSDVGSNAKAEVEANAHSLPDTANTVLGLTKPLSGEVPTIDDVKAAGKAIPSIFRGVRDTALNAGRTLKSGYDVLNDVPMAQTPIGQDFRKQPIATAQKVAGWALPAAKLFGNAVRPSPPSGGSSVSEAPPAEPPASEVLPVREPFHEGEPGALFSYNDNFGPEGGARSQYTLYGDKNHPLVKEAGNTTQSAEYFKNKGIPIVGREPRTVGKWEPLDQQSQESLSHPPSPNTDVTQAPAGQAQPAPLNFLQRFGSKGANSQAGISAETVQALTRSGQNPAEVGNMVGKRLVDEGVLGQSPSETFDNVRGMQNKYGELVNKAKDAIKAANRSTGEWNDVEDSLHVDSNRALKPLLDKKVELANSPFSANRAMARPWTEAYTYLADQANGSNGMTTLDHIDGTMQQIGQMLGKLEKGTAPYKNVSSLYGTLANMRDSMVSNIADTIGDPTLRSNLLKANQGYSFYSRIMPDIKWQAAQESVGGPEMTLMGTLTTEAKPLLAKAAVKTGSMFSSRHR